MKNKSTSSMYYVAIVCPQELNKKLLQFKTRMKEHHGCVVALKSPAHITLIPPFWFIEKNEQQLIQATQNFKSIIPSIKIELNGFSHFSNRVLFIQVTNNPLLDELRLDTETYFRNIFPFIEKELRPFHPHITIANRDLKPSAFITAWEYFSNQQFRESFNASAISLLKLIDGRWNIITENKPV